MSAPQISDDVRVRNGKLTRGRFEVPYNDPVSIAVRCSSSGTTSQTVKLHISWGDDVTVVETVFVGQLAQFEHVYEMVGDYNISVVAVNSEGTRSVQPKTAAIRVPIVDFRKKELYRWRGLALPRTTLGIAVQTVEDTYPPVSYTLAVSSREGDFETFLNVATVAGLQEAEYTISQPGRVFSSGRIVAVEANKLTLDTALNDDYDANVAELEITSRAMSSSRITSVRTKDHDWLFKASTDEDLVKSSFILNLAVRKGERVMLPEFGSNLHLIPFEQNDITTRQLLQLESVDPITTWEPRAEIIAPVVKSLADNEVEINFLYRYAGGSKDSTFTALIPLRIPDAVDAL